jgi:4-hydroxythreonine-4-phosphate dehydrogenase
VTEASTQRTKRLPVVGITMGDPCGIGPEILLRAVSDEKLRKRARLVAIADEGCLRETARELKIKWPFGAVGTEAPEGKSRATRPFLVDQRNVDAELVPGQISAAAGKAAGEELEQAVELAMQGRIDALVTGPVHKEALSLAGYADPGHTDLIARHAGIDKVGLLFWVEPFAVGLLSTHRSLKEALKRVKTGRIFEALRLYDSEWRRIFGKAPRIAVAALNPHGGEGARFGTEEECEILPAIERAREKGMVVSGPISADVVFPQVKEGEYDLVLSLYHDQATIPIKLLWPRKAVTVTVGLPFVRTSVDHGPAMDIAGRGAADPAGLVEAVHTATTLVLSLRNQEQ